MVVILFLVKNVVCNVMVMEGNKINSYSFTYKQTLVVKHWFSRKKFYYYVQINIKYLYYKFRKK